MSHTPVLTTRHQTVQLPEPHEGLDGVRLVRGASRGFTILALGGAVQPWIGTVSSSLGYYWLLIVAAAAFALAARATSGTTSPIRHGAIAALSSYLLVLPLVFMAAGTLPIDQVAYTSATALGIGALIGWATHRVAHGGLRR